MSSGFDPVPSDRLEITAEAGAALTEFDYRWLASLLKVTHSLRWPTDTLSYLTERITLEGLQIPVSQLSGFTGFTAQYNYVATAESTSSGTFTDLATVGPQLTGLPDGQYVLMYGCLAYITAAPLTARILMSVQVNSTAADSGDAASIQNSVDYQSGSISRVKTLSNGGNNTLTAKYLVGGGATTSITQRWLIALKYADL